VRAVVLRATLHATSLASDRCIRLLRRKEKPLDSPSTHKKEGKTHTAEIISKLLIASGKGSDLILSPAHKPYVKLHGKIVPVQVPGIDTFSAEDIGRMAADIIGANQFALQTLKDEGSCDVSYSVPAVARLRVNVFTQRGTCAIVMRMVPTEIPNLASLNLPAQFRDIAELKNGVVLVTGATGSGKTSSLAALLDHINSEKPYHILTIEDPIEFAHKHKMSIIHQRELHADTPRFDTALRAALRQSPDVILVGEMRDKETIEIVLEAAETGHLVFSTMHTVDASSTMERMVGVFNGSEQQAIRSRFAKSFRYVIAQRLIPRKDNNGRVAIFEILKSTLRTQEYVMKGDSDGKSLIDAMRDGSTEGMQYFDGELEKLLRAGTIDMDTCLSFATNPGNLSLQLTDLLDEVSEAEAVPQSFTESAGEIEFEVGRSAT
jgi:twitching motility protein PilT